MHVYWGISGQIGNKNHGEIWSKNRVLPGERWAETIDACAFDARRRGSVDPGFVDPGS